MHLPLHFIFDSVMALALYVSAVAGHGAVLAALLFLYSKESPFQMSIEPR